MEEAKGKTERNILSLLKMRKIQSDILFKTKTLDQESFRGNKEVWSLSLKDQQDTLMIDLTDTQISIAEEALNPLFDDAHMEMSKSSDQLSKQTFDEETQAAQKESKDIISDLINLLLEGQGQGQGKQNNENLTAMEFLMMQMGNEKSGTGRMAIAQSWKHWWRIISGWLRGPSYKISPRFHFDSCPKMIPHPKVAVVLPHQSPLNFRKQWKNILKQ